MEYFYHSTDTKNLPSVLQFGLRPNKSKTASSRGDSSIKYKVVFCTNDWHVALDYAIRGLQDHVTNPIIIRFLYDESKMIEDDWYEFEYYTRKTIKAKFDVFVWDDPENPSENGKWVPLTESVASAIAYNRWQDVSINEKSMIDLREVFLTESYSDEEMENLEIAEDYMTRYHDVMYATLSAIKKNLNNKGARQPWKLIPFPMLQKCWEDFVKHGFVRNEKVLGDIADIVVSNIIKISVNTEILGHKQYLPEDDMEDVGITKEELWDCDYLLDNKSGQYRISDYALKPLEELAFAIMKEKNAEKKLILVDRVLNTVHQRSDLASWFVQGGRSSLNKLSGLPDEEEDDE